MRHRTIVAVAVTVFAVLYTAMKVMAVPSAQMVVPDFWSPPIHLFSNSGRGMVPVHAVTLQSDGISIMGKESVLSDFFANFPFTGRIVPPPATGPFPASVTVTNENPPYDYAYSKQRTLLGQIAVDQGFCSISTPPDQNDRYRTFGGSRSWSDAASGQAIVGGLPYAMEYNIPGRTWSRLAGDMVGVANGYNGRWYPSGVQLPGSNTPVLVVGGSSYLDLSAIFKAYLANPGAPLPPLTSEDYVPNLTVEYWDSVQTFHHAVPMPADVFDEDYTKVNLLPDGRRVLMSGQSGTYWIYDTLTDQWTDQRVKRPGNIGEVPNYGASMIELPLRLIDNELGYHNGSTLTCGGQPDTESEHSCDIYDPDSNTLTRYDMGVKRSFPTIVNSFEGVLIIGGFSSDGSTDPQYVQIFSPRTKQFFVGQTQMHVQRAYHTVTPVLKEGRVFVGGGSLVGRALGGESPTAEYYYPFYFAYPRPAITKVAGSATSATLALGRSYQMVVSSATPIAEVTLFGLSSVTHDIDNAHTPVQQLITSTTTAADKVTRTVTFQITAAGHGLLPGQYWGVALDANRLPSSGFTVTVVP